MDPSMSTQELQLCEYLMELPARHGFRYSERAQRVLVSNLFWSLAGGKDEYLRLFFPGYPLDMPRGTWKLKDAQGAVEGAEYTETARGKACGHIFRAGEASYGCRTCSTDETCCLCSRCFDSTDHAGHMVHISISPGNSGCCDCGDPEAWKGPMFCTIHSMWESDVPKGKGKEAAGLPADLEANIRMTVGRVFDYICDVISCAPEQLRKVKTVQTIEQDERTSQLVSPYCGDRSPHCKEGDPSPGEFSLVLWNDEKHTVYEVVQQVSRSCKVSESDAERRAYETDSIGRSILTYDESITNLLKMAEKLEQIKLTITIRSSRETFREQMCGTLIEWLSDITGCSVGADHNILRQVVCEEMLKPWSRGSRASHASVSMMDDEEVIDRTDEDTIILRQAILIQRARAAARRDQSLDDSGDDDADDDMDGDNGAPSSFGEDEDEDEDMDDIVMVDARQESSGADVGMDWRQSGIEQSLEEDEATMAGYPPPPPPPAQGARQRARDRDLTPSDSDTAEPLIAPSIYAKANLDIPKTPGAPPGLDATPPRPGKYWLGVPTAYMEQDNVPTAEDLFQRVRLDWMILFDLRMWKKVRNDLRSLYISTVVTIPEFKRVLGLRFAGLYTTLAQLYLIGDREPDHSIINISTQMLTTPSITAEIVERGNFLTGLMAILYTFLTTRQVGHPWEVSSSAVLSFDSGSVHNRRIYHFFQDLRYLFGSPHVQERLRTDERYMMQFLDLVKLHQGICPNTRAIGEHVEYETDSWIGASLITREMNRLCRQFSQSFRGVKDQDGLSGSVASAIRLAAKAVILNSIGAEKSRFKAAEIKDEVRFKPLADFEFENGVPKYDVVKFVVEEQPISFHHALHYTLSWLIECGKSMPIEQLRALLTFTTQELKMKPQSMGRKTMPGHDYAPEDYLVAAFDYPLRVCAWLAQMKAGMWVRNGMSLRHQAGTYRGVNNRDVSHHRDIFLLQTALVVCNPSRILASVIDRFGMEKWVKGFFEQKSTAQDDIQHLDVVEDMIHLLIVLLSDRTSLVSGDDEPTAHVMAMRRDLIHVLCFKPLSFSELAQKLPDKFQDNEDFHRVLNEFTTFKAPEGMSDVGTFELKPEYLELVDPYIAHYNKNQREESETAYRKWMAKKTGKPLEEIVHEPRLRPIPSGIFSGLSAFTSTGMFAQIIYYCLLYPLVATKFTPNVPFTRVETFLQVALHLILIAIAEDASGEGDMLRPSFINSALTQHARSNFMQEAPAAKTIVALLDMISKREELKACHPKIALILKRMRQKRPHGFENAYHRLGVSVDRVNTASPANSSAADEERERKKKAALERQAKVMRQFQQQQQTFLENQGSIDWGEGLEDDEEPAAAEEHKNFWRYPTGTCILCQEETDDRRLYGTFAFLTESHILRQTDLQDPDFVREAANTPGSLDRPANDIRPFGAAGENRVMVEKVNTAGEKFVTERQVISKGWPVGLTRPGPVSVGCGHIMHYSCFEMYYAATQRRQDHQIARHHPESVEHLEFVCPLCKALGNAFLPIIWKGQEEAYPGVLNPAAPFGQFLSQHISYPYYAVVSDFATYTDTTFVSSLADKTSELQNEAWDPPSPPASVGTPRSGPFTGFHPPESSVTPGSSVPTETGNGMKELVAVYRRLRNTMRINGLKTRHVPEAPEDGNYELYASDTLAKILAYSISAVEIQQRGVGAQYGMTLLEKIPEQSLTHLRILAETVKSYIAVGGLRNTGDNLINVEHHKDSERQHAQLFVRQYLDREMENGDLTTSSPPLLSTDPFIFLCECTFGIQPIQSLEISHIVRLCYLAEIVKLLYHMGRNIPLDTWLAQLKSAENPLLKQSQLANFAEFCWNVTGLAQSSETNAGATSQACSGFVNKGFDQPGLDSVEGYYNFVKKYALTFLRKTAVLLYARFGTDFNSHISPIPDRDELDRLTTALRVPTFDEMCTAITGLGTHCDWPPETRQLVAGWIEHQTRWAGRDASDPGRPLSAAVSHPGIFELVGLPKNFDTLIEETTRRRCRTTGKDVTDAMICLLCGAVLCGQGICCLREERQPSGRLMRIGGAQQHMRECQKNTGLFINVRKCCVYHVHRLSGSWSNAPYIDKYGEVDVGLRHGRQLFLNQRRYDTMLRNEWLGHGVASFISRKLEADINNGGWETI